MQQNTEIIGNQNKIFKEEVMGTADVCPIPVVSD